MIIVTFCIGSETHGPPFAFTIVTKNSRFVFIYPIISHCEQQLERKYLTADKNYSHIFYTQVSLYKKKRETLNIFGEAQHL